MTGRWRRRGVNTAPGDTGIVTGGQHSTGAIDMVDDHVTEPKEAKVRGVVMRNRRGRTVGALIFATATMFLALVGNLQAYTNINHWITRTSSTQAGGHPDIELHISADNRSYNKAEKPPGQPCNACQDPRDIITHLPTGFIGSPSQLPQCDLADFATNECSSDTQVGVFGLFGIFTPIYEGELEPIGLYSPIYNLPPHPNEAALLGFVAPIVQFGGQISINARTESDYGLDAASYSIFHLLPIPTIDLWFWGVPASPIHDKARMPQPLPFACFGLPTDQTQPVSFFPACHPPVSSSAPLKPFLNNPTSCDEPLFAGLEVAYYDNTLLKALDDWPSTTGCDQLSFNPSLSAVPTTTQADAPSGMEAQLSVPQSQSPTVPSPSEIRATKVTLPPGFTINSNAADGKTACTDAEGAFGTRKEAHCPETSKIGTATLDTAALPAPIDGGIYLGEPLPGNRYRIFLTADGFATHVKLAGDVRPDPRTGQLEISFEDLPQAPFQLFTLHFFGSERGTLATPSQCGKYPVEAEFQPWDAMLPPQVSTSYFTIDSGPNGGPCPDGPRPFAPDVKGGVVDNTAGAFSEFGFRLRRRDGEQDLSSLTVSPPPGFLASLRGIPYCPEAALSKLTTAGYTGLSELEDPACPDASRVGSITAGTGAGSRPLYSPGDVYLAGPYKGAPVSLAVVIPAVSGPYDLGNVLVRTAIHVDPVEARVTAVADSLPEVVEGIPLRNRSLMVNLDRPDFTINPTNCDPFSIETRSVGDEGAVADTSSHFQVANCGNLGFNPTLDLRLVGGLKQRGHPAIQAGLQGIKSDANIRSVQVTLPKGELLDNAHIGTVCTRVEFANETCPDGSLIGTAEATTPLLDQPLKGPVYLRSSTHRLPDIVVVLKGQFEIVLAGRVDAVKGALRTTFSTVPDAPVSSFTLNVAGGSRGLLINSESLCTKTKRAKVRMVGQNGATLGRRVRLHVNCNSSASRRKRHRAARGH